MKYLYNINNVNVNVQTYVSLVKLSIYKFKRWVVATQPLSLAVRALRQRWPRPLTAARALSVAHARSAPPHRSTCTMHSR